MEKIDLTNDLVKRKNSRIVKMTVYVNPPFYGFTDRALGISFCRTIKKGVKKCKTGRVRWYFGSANSLGKAIANANRVHRIKIKRRGWSKVQVRAWNFSEADEIINALKN